MRKRWSLKAWEIVLDTWKEGFTSVADDTDDAGHMADGRRLSDYEEVEQLIRREVARRLPPAKTDGLGA